MRQAGEEQILQAWAQNASRWTQAVRDGEIASRRLVTDRAVIEAALARAPRTALDLGCGEGWLSRALAAQGIEVLGVDAVADLVAAASAGGGEFRQLSYDEIAAGALQQRFDVVVCNFALLGAGSVERLFAAMPSLLQPQGVFVVQTLHPLLACGDAPYVDGWREGSWAGCGGGFGAAAPWYFRTLGGWLALFERSALRLIELREPLSPDSGKPASLIFLAESARI